MAVKEPVPRYGRPISTGHIVPVLPKSKKKKLTERQRFEAWQRRTYNFPQLEWFAGGYLDGPTQFAWIGWKASARAKR